MDSPKEVTREELERCARVMEAIARDSLILSQFNSEERVKFLVAAGQVVRPEKTEIRRRLRAFRKAKHEAKRAVDKSARAATSIRVSRLDSVYSPAPRLLNGPDGRGGRPELVKPHACYICKTEFTRVHHFYDALCPGCAEFNYEKRFQHEAMPDCLKGQVALITGARLKIGYQASLMMLRAGAKVIVTTRFPRDAALRYSREADFENWGERLDVHGLDLRHSPSVEAFTQFIDRTQERLDHLINNAAQTVRRPPGFYSHMLEVENRAVSELPERAQKLLWQHESFKKAVGGDSGSQGTKDMSWLSEWHAQKLPPVPGVTASASLSQIPYACDPMDLDSSHFPEGKLDADLQQVDLRRVNSWRMKLEDVPTSELLEVQLVNSIAPYILCGKLKPLMMRNRTEQKHVVNVSAMEGKFNRHTKTDKHPHTNMAKAALNMMTLTSAREYARCGIYMNAVDTGWVTDEDPAEISVRKQDEHDFQPPLDIVDGAARVMDPVFSGIQSGKHSWGNFLKDYVPTEW